MDNKNWNYYFKLNHDNTLRETNLLYTPTMNSTGDTLCMHYCMDYDYRDNVPEKLTTELVDWFFEREVRFLKDLSYLSQTPKIYDVDYSSQKIYIEWNKETLSNILYDPNRSLDEEIPDWKEQLYTLVKDFKDAGYYKLSLYPHCFFVTKDKKIKTLDYYAVIPHSERFLERRIIEGVIGKIGSDRFDDSTTKDGLLDFKKFFEITASSYLNTYWPDSVFLKIFTDLYLND